MVTEYTAVEAQSPTRNTHTHIHTIIRAEIVYRKYRRFLAALITCCRCGSAQYIAHTFARSPCQHVLLGKGDRICWKVPQWTKS
jgi:hypothetical protein